MCGSHRSSSSQSHPTVEISLTFITLLLVLCFLTWLHARAWWKFAGSLWSLVDLVTFNINIAVIKSVTLAYLVECNNRSLLVLFFFFLKRALLDQKQLRQRDVDAAFLKPCDFLDLLWLPTVWRADLFRLTMGCVYLPRTNVCFCSLLKTIFQAKNCRILHIKVIILNALQRQIFDVNKARCDECLLSCCWINRLCLVYFKHFFCCQQMNSGLIWKTRGVWRWRGECKMKPDSDEMIVCRWKRWEVLAFSPSGDAARCFWLSFRPFLIRAEAGCLTCSSPDRLHRLCACIDFFGVLTAFSFCGAN